ncbi:histidine-containing phosphotransfer protein 4-like [Rosa chinensis]|uniref:histidine-containing phosphotransfer protein 4-like n=1 Tax=Rosa chinensis TaxID=74649 RepID=UPI001AD8D5C1|nr:histidine-containing phosphotransfer protein 4-like [Rosa chinensis]XP_040365825.1 histidine-containing phosphotransfer protein 4-like [Rosa chinensis]
MTRQEYVASLRRKETPHHSYNLDNHMHQFKGSSASIRTKKVKAECQQFREYCRAGNGECTREDQRMIVTDIRIRTNLLNRK